MSADEPLGRDGKTSPMGSLAGVAFAGGIAWVLNLAAMTLIARRLNQEYFGLLNFGLSMAAATGALLAPNLNVWGARLISEDPLQTARTIAMVNGWQTASGLLLFVILAGLYSAAIPQPLASVMISSNIMFFGVSLGLQWVAQGLRRIDLIAAFQLVSALISLCLAYVLVRGPQDVYLAPSTSVAGQVAASLLIIGVLYRQGQLKAFKVNLRDELTLLKSGAVFGWTSLCAVANQYSGYVLLQLLTNASQVGLYGAGARLLMAFMTVPAMLATVLFVRVARANATESRVEAKTWVTLALYLGGLPAALMIGDPGSVILTLYGSDYLLASTAVQFAGAAVISPATPMAWPCWPGGTIRFSWRRSSAARASPSSAAAWEFSPAGRVARPWFCR